ncbi:hypothetical protein GCM10027167_63870 [Nocardia heshunensis]
MTVAAAPSTSTIVAISTDRHRHTHERTAPFGADGTRAAGGPDGLSVKDFPHHAIVKLVRSSGAVIVTARVPSGSG